MAFQRLDDLRSGREARQREMQALALFPSEFDAGGASHNSVTGEMEAASVTDFPSEASVRTAQKEPRADRVVQADLDVAAGTLKGAIQVPAGRAAEPRRPRGTVVTSPRVVEVRGARQTSLSRFRVLVITSVAATLGTFMGIIAMVPAKPVFTPHTALVQRQTSAPVSADVPAVQLAESAPPIASAAVVSEAAVTREMSPSGTKPLVTANGEPGQSTIPTEPVAAGQGPSIAERTAVESSRKARESRGVPPDRLKFRGALSVETNLAGAGVYVDGQLVGFTPITDWQVAVGSHVVRIELDGYQRWSAVIRIVADETNHLIATLRPIEQN